MRLGAHRACAGTRKWTVAGRAPFWTAMVLGLGSTFWFLVRVIPKPSRAAYPCQQAAAATASGFVGWLLGLSAFATLFRNSLRLRHRARLLAVVLGASTGIAAAAFMVFGQPSRLAQAYSTWNPTEGPNAPLGTARGLLPGRVVWAYDPLATTWDGSAATHWWDAASADQTRVDSMVSKSVQALTGKTTDDDAWTALFVSFNQTHGRGNAGYQIGQTIVIKINQNTARQGHAQNGVPGTDQNPINGNPHLILSVLRQLVSKGHVAQADITVYDASRWIGDSIFVPCNAEFPGVHFVEQEYGGGAGREAVPHEAQWTQNVLTFAGSGVGPNLPPLVTQASYMINLATMKAHGDDAGPTLHAKNHYGTVKGLNHSWPNTAGQYSYFVELMGSKYLGENTFLFMIDALYGGPHADYAPVRWTIYPFTSWPSSVFVSQDGVASESVGWDFINAQWGVPKGCDNTLHEAAQANNPPSGTKYAPNGDGVRLPSLGAHEHWNNAIEKKYSRNLGTGEGIELFAIMPADLPPPPPLPPRTGWTATASMSNGGDIPANALDGDVATRWATGTGQANGQWFQVDMKTVRTFDTIVLDTNGGGDFPKGYQIVVSNDGASWSAAVATGTGTAAKTTITFPPQSARYVRIVQTAAAGNWWSINEIYITNGGDPPPPVDGGVGGSGGSGGSGGTVSHGDAAVESGAGGAIGTGGAGGTIGVGGAGAAGGTIGGGGAGAAGGTIGVGGAGGAGGSTSSAGAGGAGGSTNPSNTGGSSAAGGGGLAGQAGAAAGSVDVSPAAADSSGESGCSCRVSPTRANGALFVFAALGAIAARRRRGRIAGALRSGAG